MGNHRIRHDTASCEVLKGFRQEHFDKGLFKAQSRLSYATNFNREPQKRLVDVIPHLKIVHQKGRPYLPFSTMKGMTWGGRAANTMVMRVSMSVGDAVHAGRDSLCSLGGMILHR